MSTFRPARIHLATSDEIGQNPACWIPGKILDVVSSSLEPLELMAFHCAVFASNPFAIARVKLTN